MARSTVFRYKGKGHRPRKRPGTICTFAPWSRGLLAGAGIRLIVRAELMNVATAGSCGVANTTASRRKFLPYKTIFQRQFVRSSDCIHRDEKQRLTKRYNGGRRGISALSEGTLSLEQTEPRELQKAVEYFRKALDKDPAYSLAYAGLG